MILTQGPDWSASRVAHAQDERWLLPYFTSRKNIAQWGTAAIADLLPKHCEYRGFETSAALLAQTALPAERRDPALPLPLETASQDLFLVLDFLEYLRMDQLYMVISEARRVLRPAGIAIFRGLSTNPGLLGRAWNQVGSIRPGWVRGRRALEFTHYISPEDWRTLHDSHVRGWCTSQQTLILERL